jgi:hypothetical protein
MGFLSSAKSAIMGDSGGSKSSSAPSTVWKDQAPYLTANYKAGQNLAQQQMASGSQFNQQQGALNSAWQQQLSGPTNPYLTGMASNAMSQISKQFNEQIMPNLLGGGNAAGQLGGERYMNMQNSAVDTAATAMANAAQNVYGQAWDSGLAAQSSAIGQGNQVMNAPWQPLINQAAIVGGPTVLGGGSTSKTTNPSEGLLSMAAKGIGAFYGAGG